MLFFGYTRFSIYSPGAKGWNISSIDSINSENKINNYRDHLFSEERLSVRSEIFFNLSLPIIASQAKDYQFFHIIKYSDLLPQKYKDMLEKAKNEFPFLILDETTSTRNRDILKDIIKKKILDIDSKGTSQLFGYFSLDDDDLLSCDYLSAMEEYISKPYVGKIISFGKGITAIFDQGKISHIRDAYVPKINIGMMRVCEYNVVKDLFTIPPSHSHAKQDYVCPVILDSRLTHFCWLRHLNQDTNFRKKECSQKSQLLSSLDAHSPTQLENDKIVSLFPTLYGIISSPPKSIILYSGSMELNHNLYFFEVPEFTNTYESLEFYYQFECDEQSKVSSAHVLISFVFDKKDLGIPPAELGLALSNNQDIGYFKYVKFKTEKGIEEKKHFIPYNSRAILKKIGIRKWNYDGVVSLKKLEISCL